MGPEVPSLTQRYVWSLENTAKSCLFIFFRNFQFFKCQIDYRLNVIFYDVKIKMYVLHKIAHTYRRLMYNRSFLNSIIFPYYCHYFIFYSRIFACNGGPFSKYAFISSISASAGGTTLALGKY